MIIERIQQQLITRVRRGQAELPGDAEAEQHGHLIVDHGTAHCIDLRRRQHVEQSRTRDEPPAAVGCRQESIERLDAVVDDHRLLG